MRKTPLTYKTGIPAQLLWFQGSWGLPTVLPSSNHSVTEKQYENVFENVIPKCECRSEKGWQIIFISKVLHEFRHISLKKYFLISQKVLIWHTCKLGREREVIKQKLWNCLAVILTIFYGYNIHYSVVPIWNIISKIQIFVWFSWELTHNKWYLLLLTSSLVYCYSGSSYHK